jgi:hypothetical protein
MAGGMGEKVSRWAEGEAKAWKLRIQSEHRRPTEAGKISVEWESQLIDFYVCWQEARLRKSFRLVVCEAVKALKRESFVLHSSRACITNRLSLTQRAFYSLVLLLMQIFIAKFYGPRDLMPRLRGL